MPKYLVNQGLDYGNRRAEAGDVVDDIPTKSISWLKEQGIIEPFDGVSKKKNDVGLFFLPCLASDAGAQEECAMLAADAL